MNYEQIRSGVVRETGRLRAFIGIVFFLGPGVAPLLAEGPNANEILQELRLTQCSQHRILLGKLTTGENSVKLRLIMNGPEIRYEFENPKQILALKMGEQSSRLEEITQNGSHRIPSSRMNELVRNSDASFDDLALRFLYWKDARIVGSERVGIMDCHIIELRPEHSCGSQYGRVMAWISKSNGVLAKAECFAPNDRMASSFRLVSPLKLHDGTWFFGKMRILRMVDGKPKEPWTYLTITGEE